MNLIDFHVHIDYYENYNDIFNYYNSNNIYALFVTNLPEIYDKCIENFGDSKYVKLALGYNPQFAGKEKFNKKIFDKYFKKTKYIGEVGLDYSKEYLQHKISQLETFEYIAHQCGEHNKILSIHSRNAESEVINILEKMNIKYAVFHWYTGSVKELERINEMGYYLSLNYAMLKSKNGKEIIKNVPLDKILIETDGPFANIKGRNVKPDNLEYIYRSFSDSLNVQDLKSVINENLKCLLEQQLRATK